MLRYTRTYSISAKLNPKYKDLVVSEIELVPNHHGRWFDIRYKFKVDQETSTPISNINNFASIDLGVVNLATI